MVSWWLALLSSLWLLSGVCVAIDAYVARSWRVGKGNGRRSRLGLVWSALVLWILGSVGLFVRFLVEVHWALTGVLAAVILAGVEYLVRYLARGRPLPTDVTEIERVPTAGDEHFKRAARLRDLRPPRAWTRPDIDMPS